MKELITLLREVDALGVTEEAARLARRDILNEWMKKSPVVRKAMTGVLISEQVLPLIEKNRGLAKDRNSCAGPEFDRIVRRLGGKRLHTIIPTGWLAQRFDPLFSLKLIGGFAKDCSLCLIGIVIAATAILWFGGGFDTYFPRLVETTGFVAAMFVIVIFFSSLKTFAGAEVKKLVRERVAVSYQMQREAAYVDTCIKDAISLKNVRRR